MDITRIKELVRKSLLSNNSVWFGCDVGKNFCKSLAVLDTETSKLQELLFFDINMTK